MHATQGESRQHQLIGFGALITIGFALLCLPIVQFVSCFYPNIAVPAYFVTGIVCLIAITAIIRTHRQMREVENLVRKLPARKVEITIYEAVDEGTSTFYALVVEKNRSQWFSLSSAFTSQQQLSNVREMNAIGEIKQGLDQSAVVILKIAGLDRELRGYPVGGTPAALCNKDDRPPLNK